MNLPTPIFRDVVETESARATFECYGRDGAYRVITTLERGAVPGVSVVFSHDSAISAAVGYREALRTAERVVPKATRIRR